MLPLQKRSVCLFLSTLIAAVSPLFGSTVFFGPTPYVLATGAPSTFSDNILYDPAVQGCEGKAAFLLKIDNGGAGTTGPVSSATVALNGVVLAAERNFNGQPQSWEQPIALIPGSNRLVVELKGGKPGNGLVITIRKQTEEALQAPFTFTLAAKQQTFTAAFAAANPADQFVIVATNGDGGGLHRVESGSVSLNGVVIISDKELTGDTATVRKSAVLHVNNAIAVSLKGNAGDYVSVVFKRILDDNSCGVTVRINAPDDGATVTTRRLLVTGTATGKDVAVTVSGFSAAVDLTHAATLADPAPWLVELDPVPGIVHLTANVANAAGASAKAERDVTFAPAAESVMLEASPSSGAAPFRASYFLNTRLSSEVSLYEVDLDGDGIFEVQSATPPTSLAHTFETPTVYLATARVTTADGAVFTTTTPVVVQPFAVVDAQLRAIWAKVMDAFRRGDVNAALASMTASARDRYRTRLVGIQSALPGVANSVQQLLTKTIGAKTAHYLVTRLEDGHVMGHHVFFSRDEMGVWRLEQF